MNASAAIADSLLLGVKRRLVPSIDSLFHRTIDSMMKWINRQLFGEIRFTRNARSGAITTYRHKSSSRLRKNFMRTLEFHRSVHLGQQEHTTQDAQKGQTSHPPNPGAPRRAVPRARPQRAKRRGVRFGTLSL